MVNAGRTRGTIVAASLQKNPNGGKAPYVMVTFQVNDDTVDWFATMSTTAIQQGENAGKAIGEINSEKLVALGWQGDFSDFSGMIGTTSTIVVEYRTNDRGQVNASVKSVFVSNGTPADAGDIADLKKNFGAAILMAKKNRKAPPAKATNGAPSGNRGGPPDDFGPTDYEGNEPF
jgi:hypothetical protein